MRTKTLLLTAALGALGIAASAQTVYSVNVVGYVNKTIPTGFSIISNPLDNGANTVASLFASVPDNVTIFRFNGTTYTSQTSDGGFPQGSQVIAPGEGFFIRNSSGAAFTTTFVGQISAGTSTNPIPTGFSIKASMIPQAGKVTTDLSLPAQDNDTVYKFNNATSGYSSATYDGGWGLEPVVDVAEGFFYKAVAPRSWKQTFVVGN